MSYLLFVYFTSYLDGAVMPLNIGIMMANISIIIIMGIIAENMLVQSVVCRG